MDTLPDEYLAIPDDERLGLTKMNRSSRRRHDHEAMAAAHVVVATTAGKPKPPKPEAKKLRRKLNECEQEKQSLAQYPVRMGTKGLRHH